MGPLLGRRSAVDPAVFEFVPVSPDSKATLAGGSQGRRGTAPEAVATERQRLPVDGGWLCCFKVAVPAEARP